MRKKSKIRHRGSSGQTYVPFTDVDLKRLNDHLDATELPKGWVIRQAVREYLDRHPAEAKLA